MSIISYLHNIKSSSENTVGMLGIIAICLAIPLSTSRCKIATALVPEILCPGFQIPCSRKDNAGDVPAAERPHVIVHKVEQIVCLD